MSWRFAITVPLLRWWYKLRTNLWLIPAVMAAASAALAILLLILDDHVGEAAWIPALRIGDKEAARAVLAATATSMITVASVTFSITMAVLVLTTSQFGPRLLSNFMRDPGNQVVLGTFTATFLYCLIVMAGLGWQDQSRTPRLSVLVGILLAACGVGVLIYFIHHVASIIQVDHVVHRVAMDLMAAVQRTYPSEGGARPNSKPPEDMASASADILSPASGYVQSADIKALLLLAHQRQVIVDIVTRPGRHVVARQTIAHVYPGHKLTDELHRLIAQHINIGEHRTHEQDVEYSVDQLVEVALRALSPSLNDPFTAIRCVDWLGAALAHVAERQPAHAHHLDDDGQLRLVLRLPQFDEMLDTAVRQIRQNSEPHPALLIRLLEVLDRVLDRVRRRCDLQAIASQVEVIYRTADRCTPEPADLASVRERYEAIGRRLRRLDEDFQRRDRGTNG